MSKFMIEPKSIVFLRGAQEEMFNKLLQLQIAPNPIEILDWIFSHGVDKIVYSYLWVYDKSAGLTADAITCELLDK